MPVQNTSALPTAAPATPAGVVVEEVAPGSFAAKAGLLVALRELGFDLKATMVDCAARFAAKIAFVHQATGATVFKITAQKQTVAGVIMVTVASP